ncbi:MAG: hypothetical protein BAJATHORv1_40140 [Candidatus Thorarchaeota archaeon]|nr:MAG: hypothetical protein BAJATHORv1_40140 [Candidatus Thorarchaeota archaeon]
MIAKLESQLTHICKDSGYSSKMIDATSILQMAFNNPDRNIIKARIKYSGQNEKTWIVVIVGLRSSVLQPFNKFTNIASGQYSPCDIFGIVPCIAQLVRFESTGPSLSAIVKDDVTRIVLVFEGDSEARLGPINSLATRLWRFMKRWDEWTEVLLGILERDQYVGDWELNWRELLAGESGFVTMPWFSPLHYDNRVLAMARIVTASKALLTSVLSGQQMSDSMITGLLDWLENLEPLPRIESAPSTDEEVMV